MNAVKKTAAKKGEANPELAAELAAELGVDLAALKAAQERAIAESNIERPAAAESDSVAPVAETPAAPKPALNWLTDSKNARVATWISAPR